MRIRFVKGRAAPDFRTTEDTGMTSIEKLADITKEEFSGLLL
jgi:hypothetical protein